MISSSLASRLQIPNVNHVPLEHKRLGALKGFLINFLNNQTYFMQELGNLTHRVTFQLDGVQSHQRHGGYLASIYPEVHADEDKRGASANSTHLTAQAVSGAHDEVEAMNWMFHVCFCQNR